MAADSFQTRNPGRAALRAFLFVSSAVPTVISQAGGLLTVLDSEGSDKRQ